MAVEDFTTYTEVDPNNHIGLLGTNYFDFYAYRNEDAYLYKNKGADYFGDFEHKIDVKIASYSYNYAYGCPWSLTNDVDDVYGLISAGKSFLTTFATNVGLLYSLSLIEIDAGTGYDDAMMVSKDTWYYLTIRKSGTDFTCKVYTDSARTTLLDTLSLVLHHDLKYRYIFPADTYNDGNALRIILNVQNLEMQAIAPPLAGGASHGYIIG